MLTATRTRRRLATVISRWLSDHHTPTRRCANCSRTTTDPHYAEGRAFCSTDCAKQWWADT